MVDTILPQSVIVAQDRQRQEIDMEPLAELIASIKEHGLIHAISVRAPNDTILIAGERRLRACKYILGQGGQIRYGGKLYDAIPCIYVGDMSPLQLQQFELEENIRRVDLTWQEKAKAIAKLHKLSLAANPNHTAQDTLESAYGREAAEFLNATREVRDSVILQDHLNDPEIAKAPTQKEAVKILKKKLEKQSNALLADFAAPSSSDHQLLLGNALGLLRSLDSALFDCICTDPPYGVGADSFGEQAGMAHTYQDTPDYAMECYLTLASEGMRVTKAEAHLYAFCDLKYWSQLVTIFEGAGWYVWQTPIIWAKGNGILPRPDHAPRRTYEACLYAIKGNKRVYRVEPDVISIPMLQGEKKQHGAQKPVELYTNLLSRSCLPGNKVLDPFAGSGTIFPAANRLGLQATAINLNRDDYNLSLTRMRGVE